MIQNKAQFQEWFENEMIICVNYGIVYLKDFKELRKNISEEAHDKEIERGIDQELENKAEPEIEWVPAFL